MRFLNLKNIFIFTLLVFIANCSQDPVSSLQSEPSSINLNITVDKTNLQKLQSNSLNKPADIARVVLTIEGPDMETINQQLTKSGNSYSASVEVPKGSNRIFLVQAYDQSNFVQYEGTTTRNIESDEENVSLTLNPQYPTPVVLSVVHITNNSVSLYWTRNEDEDFYAYMVLASETSQLDVDNDVIQTIEDRDQTTFTATGLSPNKTYYFQVLAVDTELLYHRSNVETITTESSQASAVINDIWVDHNYMDYDINGNYTNGMLMHFDFDISGQQGMTCLLTCWFYYAYSADPLVDFNGYYYDSAGNVAVQGTFVPSYASSNFGDYTLFMPYDELHMLPGTSDLRFATGIFDSNGNMIAYENADIDQYFTFTQTSNSIQVTPKKPVQ